MALDYTNHIYAFVSMENSRTLKFSTARTSKKCLTIYDGPNPVFSFAYDQDTIVVNKRYTIYGDGTVAYEYSDQS